MTRSALTAVAFAFAAFSPAHSFALPAGALPAGAAQSPAQEARQLIQALPAPQLPDVIFNEYTATVTITQAPSAQIESEFWAATLYAQDATNPPLTYEIVRKLSENNPEISSFRFTGGLTVSYFLARYVAAAPARDRLVRLLSGEGALGTGYLDQLSDPFGDQLFVFEFGSERLVIRIHHVYA